MTPMRLTRNQIRMLAGRMVSELAGRGLVELISPEEEAVQLVERAITDDLQVEDRLNDEVKDILKRYEREIEQGRLDYKTMFDMVKKKLVRERGVIL